MVNPFVSLVDLGVVLFAFLTLVGDAWFVLIGLSGLYWVGPRYIDRARSVAVVCVGFAVVGLAVVLTIKTATALPRPASTPLDPTGLPSCIGWFVAGEIDASGFGFPSGHTVAATVVYGGLAVFLSVGRRRLRYLAAGGVIGLVGLSRLVLEVHYPRDVIAGVLVGAAIVALGGVVGRETTRLRADRLFGLAAVIASVGIMIAASGGHTRELTQGAIALGTALAGGLIWYRWGRRLIAAPVVSVPVAVIGLAGAGGLWVSAYIGVLSTLQTTIASGLAVSCILLLPLVSEQRQKYEKSDPTEA